jgi:putative DNA methylase
MPLANSFELSRKKGRKAFIQPIIEGKKIRYVVRYGDNAHESPKLSRGNFKCVACGSPVDGSYIKAEGVAKRLGVQLMAIVAEGDNGRLYITPDDEQRNVALCTKPEYTPDGEMIGKAGDQLPLYGFTSFSELFTNRQLTAMTTFRDLVQEARKQVVLDGGSEDYARAIGVYLAFSVDKLADTNSMCVTWNITRDGLRNTFSRQALAMTWDFAEGNPLGNSSGCYSNALEWIRRSLLHLPADKQGFAVQHDAQTDIGFRNIMVSTDPPYYDNICYADLSDYFYVWLRGALKSSYPDLFQTMQVPKAEELIASPYRFNNGFHEAKVFFEDGMLQTFQQINRYTRDDIPVTVYYAFKQSDNDISGNTASTGWETMLSAILQAGFSITGTWPIRTEREARTIATGTNALASSIVLVCRKRPADAPICTRRNFINTLKRELKPALKKLQQSNIAPVDMAQSAIGPGMGVYSRFSKVLEADGNPMSVRSALQIINQELDLFFTEQDGELDSDSRFCVDLYTQYAFNEMKFGEADVLARAKNTSVEKLAARGVLYAQKGIVRLFGREEIPEKIDREIIWLLTQQLTRAFEKDGVTGAAKIVAGILTSEPEQAKGLAYRLFQTAERKGWTQEAYAYNSLVISWPEIQNKAAELMVAASSAEQLTFFDLVNK